MTPVSKLMCGIILLSVPTIEYGGYFLLSMLSGKQKIALTDFQKSMFRAGHAHAGVLVILALLTEILADYSALAHAWEWIARIGFPSAAILISGGFFACAIGPNITKPTRLIFILYTGILVLTLSAVILGIGLIKG
jgi:hypothetical protein